MAESRIQKDKEYCYICGKALYGVVDPHHIFEGTANRRKSDEDGFVVYVHRCCHTWLHNHPLSMITYKKRAQRIFEEELGSREDFIKRYGKSYL